MTNQNGNKGTKKETLENIKKKEEKLSKNLANTANELNKTRNNLEIAKINSTKNIIKDSEVEMTQEIEKLINEQKEIILRGLKYHPGRIYGVTEVKNKKIDDDRRKVIEDRIKKLENDIRALQPIINGLNNERTKKINIQHTTSVKQSTNHTKKTINKKSSFWRIFTF